MKKTIVLTIFLLVFKIALTQSSIGNSIIFTYSIERSEAYPLVIYKNGQYLEIPQINYQDRRDNPDYYEHIEDSIIKELSSFDSLYLLIDGIKCQSIKIKKEKPIIYGEWLPQIPIDCSLFENNHSPKLGILTNNSKLGINNLQNLKERESIPFQILTYLDLERKENYKTKFEIDLISKVDIDGDRIPEIFCFIHSIDSYSGYQIYSKKNGEWKMVWCLMTLI